MARFINIDGYRKLFDEEYKETKKLIEQGETHLDNLAEGFHEASQVIDRIPTDDVVQVIRCKDCLYFEYKIGSYGTCEHWHTNSQDIFDLHFCGYAEPRTPKERGGDK